MNTEPDEALRRLRAADPAAGSTADLAAIRRGVAARVGETDEGDGADHDDELVAARARRASAGRGRGGRRGLLVAASVAALAVFGGGGYAVGAATGPANDGGGTVAQSGAPEGGGAAGNEGSSEVGAAMGAAGDGVKDEAADAMLAGYGRIQFTAHGLSDAGTTAEAYGLDATGALTAERVAQLAQALGLDGEPVLADGAWMVGSWENGEPVLSVYVDGTASTSYNNPSIDPWVCADLEQVEPQANADDYDCGNDQVAAGEDEALAAAQDVLSAAGIDVADFDWSVTVQSEGATAVEATPALGADGIDAAVGWQFTVTTGGVASLWGSLAQVYSLGEYDVISPVEAVARLTDPRFGGAGGGIMPYSVADAEAADSAVSTDSDAAGVPTTAPAPVEPGSPIGWPVAQVTITGAELTLTSVYQSDGAVVLVPAWRLTDADGGTWIVNAVADSGLDFSAE